MQHTPSRHTACFLLGSKCSSTFSLETSLAICFSLFFFCHFFFPPVVFLILFVYTRCSSFLVESFSLWLFVISSFLWLCLLLLPFFLILFVYTRYVHPWKQPLGKKAKICLLLQLEWCLQDKEVWIGGWHFQNKEVCSTLHMWKRLYIKLVIIIIYVHKVYMISVSKKG